MEHVEKDLFGQAIVILKKNADFQSIYLSIYIPIFTYGIYIYIYRYVYVPITYAVHKKSELLKNAPVGFLPEDLEHPAGYHHVEKRFKRSDHTKSFPRALASGISQSRPPTKKRTRPPPRFVQN